MSLFQMAFIIAFFAALRIGELVAPNKKANFSHMAILQHVLYIFIARSKTDQLGRGVWLTLRPIPESNLCPVFNVSHNT